MELVIRIVDKPSTGDSVKDALRNGAGDVIDILPDGHQWTKAELSNPEWRIVKVPLMTRQESVALLAPQIDETGNLVRKRQVRVNLDTLQSRTAVDVKAERPSGKENVVAPDVQVAKVDFLASASLKGEVR